MKKPVLVLSSLILSQMAFGQILGYDMVSSSSMNLISYTNSAPLPFTSAGDGFDKYQRGVSSSIPFDVLDDSVSVFPTDGIGIIGETDSDIFFGLVDTVNGDTSGPITATWVFDISGGTTGQLRFSLDIAAMGDFEATDMVTLTGQVDAGAVFDLFTFSVDENGVQDYTMDGGSVYTLNDPMLLNGTMLNNNLATFSNFFAGTGSTFTVALSAETDGGGEPVVIRNMTISAVPEPSTVAAIFGLFALGYVMYRRRK